MFSFSFGFSMNLIGSLGKKTTTRSRTHSLNLGETKSKHSLESHYLQEVKDSQLILYSTGATSIT